MAAMGIDDSGSTDVSRQLREVLAPDLVMRTESRGIGSRAGRLLGQHELLQLLGDDPPGEHGLYLTEVTVVMSARGRDVVLTTSITASSVVVASR